MAPWSRAMAARKDRAGALAVAPATSLHTSSAIPSSFKQAPNMSLRSPPGILIWGWALWNIQGRLSELTKNWASGNANGDNIAPPGF